MDRTPVKRVLAVVKPGQRGLPPAAYRGRVLAERFGAELTIMSVMHESMAAMRLGRGGDRGTEAQRAMLDAERLHLERIAASVRDWGVKVETEVRWHQPAYEAVVQAAAERRADLVAVDVLDPSTLHTRLTDTDWQLMRHCPCPLLYVNDAELAGYGTVVAAVDPTHAGPLTDETDRAVLSLAAALAGAFDSQLRIVHAYPDPASYSWVSAVQVSPGVFFGAENLERAHRVAIEGLAAEFGIGAASVDTRAGEPGDVIVDLAAERRAGLIVLGALERGGVEQALLGSTAETVAAEADCDVLLVRAHAPAAGRPGSAP